MAVKNTVIKQEFDYLLNHFGSKVTFFHTDPSHMNYNPTYDEYYGGTLQLIGDGNLQTIVITKPAEIVEMYKESGAYPFKDLNQTVIFKCSANDVKKAGLVDDNFNFTYADDVRTFPVEGILNETYIRYRGEFYMCVDVRKALIYQGETSAVYFTAELDIGFKKSIYQNSMYGGDFQIEIVEPTEYYTVYVDEVALPTQYRAGDIVTLTVPTKEGYIFDGWETYDTVTVSAENTFVMVAQDIYITSKWIEEVVRYNVYVDSVLYGAYAEGETITLTPATREGYRFIRFTSSDVTISAQNTFNMPAKTVNVTSVYVQVFEVYVDNVLLGQYAENETVSIDAGTRTNYEFVNWTSTSAVIFANSQSARTTFSMLAETVYVTSNWTANFWTVTVSQSYGYNGEYTVTKGQSFTLQHGSRAENYGFTNWVITSGSATGDLTQDTATIYPTSNVEIRAEWTKLGDYSVTYSGYTHAKTWHFEGDTVTVQAPAKDGYDFSRFEGVYYEVGTKKYVTFADYTGMNNPNTFTMPAFNVTVTAKYDAWAYTVTFTVDGETYHTQQVGYAHKVSKPTDPVKEGYDFIEWRYNNTAVNFNDEITQNRTYVAFFRQQITYNTVTLYNSGTVYQTIQVVSGQAISTAIQTLPTPTHTDFERFNGWQNPLTLEFLTLNTVITADTAYTANWTTLYSVQYAGFTHATEYFAQGETVNISAPNVTGKNFVNWTADNTVSFVDSTAQNTSFTMINSNLTVTANYADIYYTVTFEVDSQTYTSSSVIYGGTVNAPTQPTKQYYTFNEWKYNGVSVDFTAQIYEDRTYTADFTQDTYTITYMVDTDTYATQTVLGGESIGSFPTDPTPATDYTFDGWKLNDTLINTSYIPTSNITLVAQFSLIVTEVSQIDQTTPIPIVYGRFKVRAQVNGGSTQKLNYISTYESSNYEIIDGIIQSGTGGYFEEKFTVNMYAGNETGGHTYYSKADRFGVMINGYDQYQGNTYGTAPNPNYFTNFKQNHTVEGSYLFPPYKNLSQGTTPDGIASWSNIKDTCLVTYSKWHYDPNDEDLEQAPIPATADNPIVNPTNYLTTYDFTFTIILAGSNLRNIVNGSLIDNPQLVLVKSTPIGQGWYRHEWTTFNTSYFSMGTSMRSTSGSTNINLPDNPPT